MIVSTRNVRLSASIVAPLLMNHHSGKECSMMRTTLARALVTLAATALMYGAAPLAALESRIVQAQDSSAPQTQTDSRAGQAPQETRTAQGQLMRVDTDAKTISIQSAQGGPMVFRFTDATKVVGGERGVAGLATMSGEQVTVRYMQHDKDYVAAEIEIHTKG
jgi:hypothetical protein